CRRYLEDARKDSEIEILCGGNFDNSVGWFIEPTILVTRNPKSKFMQEEIFGPIVTLFVYPAKEFESAMRLCDETSPYALTGSIFANDRVAIEKAEEILENAAGNFYINDKPTG